MTAQRALFVGDPSHHEFQEPVAWLSEYCDLAIVRNLGEAAAQLTNGHELPNVIVLAAARPGLCVQRDVVSLLRRAPLARIIGLMGGWCEGELRTGQPWRGVTRVYWHQFVSRMAEELEGINVRGRLAMPRTFTEWELSNVIVPLPDVRQRGLAVIRATTLETYEAIAEACQAIGHSTTWVNPRQPAFVSGAAVAIWDIGLSIERDETELAEFARQVHPAPVIALIGFPRTSDRQRAAECGATCVVSKPYLLQELWPELTRVTVGSQTADSHISAA